MSGVGLQDELDARGYAVLPALVRADDCAALRARFDDDAAFRSTVVMERHGYGHGVYRYFAAPVPPLVAALRARLYAELAPVANAWAEALREDVRYPATLDGFLERCREAGQTRPTPLLLRYRAGDHNALHRDLYGDVAFPLQATVLLDEPGRDFEGGEFVLVEQHGRLKRKRDVPVQIAVKRVVVAGAIPQQQRRRPRLPGLAAALEEAVERRGIAHVLAQRLGPGVRDRRQLGVQPRAQRGDQRRHRRGEISVDAASIPVPLHHDRTAERRIVVEPRAQRRAIVSPHQRGQHRVAACVEFVLQSHAAHDPADVARICAGIARSSGAAAPRSANLLAQCCATTGACISRPRSFLSFSPCTAAPPDFQ